MKKYYFILFIGLIFIRCSPSENDQITDKPNVLIILTDDQGWGDLSIHGNDSIETPFIDALASENINFERFYVSPVCAPTRAAMLTGRYPFRTGVSGVTNRREVMRAEEVTIAEILKNEGYVTGCFGKWHNGEQYPNHPNGQGFDDFFGFTAGHWNNYFNTTLDYNGEEVKTEGFIVDVLTDSAISFIEKNQRNPFLCYIPYNTPHSPFQLPDKYFNKYKAKGFDDKNASVYGMVENIDDNIGRLLNTLDSLKIKDNTIVIFFTDNGPNGHRYNGGMKGVKGWVDEGGVRVPFFLSYPARFETPKAIDRIAAHIDILPTILDLCNISVPGSLNLDGKSLVPLMENDEDQWSDRYLFTSWGKKGSVRDQRYRLVVTNRDTSLYDMFHDPGQHLNIAREYSDRTNRMALVYNTWMNDVLDKGLTPPPVPWGYEEAPFVKMPAHEATLYGGLEYKEGHGWANDWITNWHTTSGMATWPVEVITEGSYMISLLYDVSHGQEGAEIEISIGNQNISTVIAQPYEGDLIHSPDRVPRKEVYEKEWGKLEVGMVELSTGRYDLKVTAKEIPSFYAMELKGVLVNKIN